MTFPGNGPSSLTGKTPACRLDIFIRIGKEHCNSWKIWVYPEDTRVDFGDVRFTADYNEALELLGKRSKVLFNPAELSGFEEMQDVFGTAEKISPYCRVIRAPRAFRRMSMSS